MAYINNHLMSGMDPKLAVPPCVGGGLECTVSRRRETWYESAAIDPKQTLVARVCK